MSENKAGIGGFISGSAVVGAIAWMAHGARAAAITSTLATTGGVVGGGMAAGVAVTVALPLLVGGLIYGGIKLYETRNKD